MSQIFESLRMRVLTTKLRVEIENEMRVFLESLNFKIRDEILAEVCFWQT